MSFTNYLFSFEGRINRAKLWLFILVGFAWNIVIVAVIMAGFGTAGLSLLAQGQATPSALTLGMTAMIAAAAIVLLFLAYLYAAIAVTVKRLHDRNKGAVWLLVFWILPMALYIVGFAVIAAATAAGGQHTGDAVLALPFSLGGFAIAIWAFVELYCLRGTAGDNRFGADPLAGKA